MHYTDTVSYIPYITTVACILRSHIQYSIYIKHTNNLTTTTTITTYY